MVELMSRTRVVVMLVAFIGLTAIGVWWAAPDRDILASTVRELVALGPVDIAVVLAISGAAFAAEMLRLYVCGRAIGLRVPARTTFDATVANHLFSWLSPGGLAGEPAAVYVMRQRGVPLDGALAIVATKFATSVAVIYGTSIVLALAGFGPAIPWWAMFSIAIAIVIGVVVWLLRRRLLRRTVFPSVGRAAWLAILASHIIYYTVYVGLLVTLAWMFGARSVAAIVPIAIIYQGFTYLAPAPGLPEASAALFFDSQLPGASALIVILLFRGLTAYLQIVVGLIYLPVIIPIASRRAATPANPP